MVIAEYADRHLREIRGANMIGLRLILDDASFAIPAQ